MAVNWEDPKDEVKAQNGILKLPAFKKHDFRVLVIEKPGREAATQAADADTGR